VESIKGLILKIISVVNNIRGYRSNGSSRSKQFQWLNAKTPHLLEEAASKTIGTSETIGTIGTV
jgi:hypothetical protein